MSGQVLTLQRLRHSPNMTPYSPNRPYAACGRRLWQVPDWAERMDDCHVGVLLNFDRFGEGKAAMAVGATGGNEIFGHSNRRISSTLSTLPAESTVSSTTSPGVDMMP